IESAVRSSLQVGPRRGKRFEGCPNPPPGVCGGDAWGLGADEGEPMPGRIRRAGAACLFGTRQGSAWSRAAFSALPILAVPARAQGGDPLVRGLAYVDTIRGLDAQALAGLTLFFGALIFAVVTAILLVRTRERLRVERARARSEVAALNSEID